MRSGCGGAQERILIRGGQFGELCQALGHSRDVPQLNQVLRLEDVHHPVAPDLPDDGLHSVQGGVLERERGVRRPESDEPETGHSPRPSCRQSVPGGPS